MICHSCLMEKGDFDMCRHCVMNQKKAEKWDEFIKLPKCSHSCDCTDCQMKCLRCSVELREMHLQNEIKQLKEVLGNTQADLHIANEMMTTSNLKLDMIEELTKDWERVIVSALDASKLRKILKETKS